MSYTNEEEADPKHAMTPTEKAVSVRLEAASKPEETWPRLNLYKCRECEGEVFTLDVADGTTPFMLPCIAHKESVILNAGGGNARPKCHGQMQSCFYAVKPEEIPLPDVRYEWRYATLPEYQAYRAKHMSLATHVADGGLVLHLRKNPDAPFLTHGGFFMRPNGERLSDKEVSTLHTGLQVLKETLRLERAKAKRKEGNRRRAKENKVAKRRAKGRKR